MENLNVENKKTVLFVTSNADLSNFCYDLFDHTPILKKDYFIDGTAPTREQAIKTAKREHPNLIIFFEKTHGEITLSETLYTLRLAGSRVIYLSSERSAGDLVLEAAVSFGVYDIILNDVITKQQLVDLIYNPRDFRDVSLFFRRPDVPDSGVNGNKQKFKIPDIGFLSSYSKHLSEDYLEDTSRRIAERQKPSINNKADKKSVRDVLYKAPKKKEVVKKVIKPVVHKKSNTVNGVGDLDDFE